jgi:hypothetical protein
MEGHDQIGGMHPSIATGSLHPDNTTGTADTYTLQASKLRQQEENEGDTWASTEASAQKPHLVSMQTMTGPPGLESDASRPAGRPDPARAPQPACTGFGQAAQAQELLQGLHPLVLQQVLSGIGVWPGPSGASGMNSAGLLGLSMPGLRPPHAAGQPVAGALVDPYATQDWLQRGYLLPDTLCPRGAPGPGSGVCVPAVSGDVLVRSTPGPATHAYAVTPETFSGLAPASAPVLANNRLVRNPTLTSVHNPNCIKQLACIYRMATSL